MANKVTVKVLYSSKEIREELHRIYADTAQKRIAISAFVGMDAISYLPNPKGIMLICWPKEGGTNPDGIRRLIEEEVDVHFCDSMHIKLYWTQKHGAIITSANLSSNAMDTGHLLEFGILLPSRCINIKKLLSSLKIRQAKENEIRTLDVEHDHYYRKKQVKPSTVKQTFLKWYNSKYRKNWKGRSLQTS